MYSCQAKKSHIIEILWRWHNLLEKLYVNVVDIIHYTLTNWRRQLTATFVKCILHKWNTKYTHYKFTQFAIIFFIGGKLWSRSNRMLGTFWWLKLTLPERTFLIGGYLWDIYERQSAGLSKARARWVLTFLIIVTLFGFINWVENVKSF